MYKGSKLAASVFDDISISKTNSKGKYVADF